MTPQTFPVGGWRRRTVAVHRPQGKPALLRLRSRGPLTTFSAEPRIDTPQEQSSHAALFHTWGTSWHPFVLPGRYTHLEVRKVGENGVARWQLDRMRADDLPALPTTAIGRGTRLYTWEGGHLELRYECLSRSTRYLDFRHHAFGTGEPLDFDKTGSTRGTVRLSGPGYLWVHSEPAGDWRLRPV
ncbi:hypothetical protein [Streptomyces sp. NPDC007264]|uniref:hypothetical protein n=1 Tax=Streptomyces sp. NPDC007264 TaxID=3364777 RepID=UPI0036DA158F